MDRKVSGIRIGVTVYRIGLAVGWLGLFAVSVKALQLMGLNSAGTVFISDFDHPWRAQFNTDLGLHLLLAGSWMIYRTRSLAIGALCAVLAINLGGLFTLAYVLVASFRAEGDFRKVLLGCRYSN